MSTGGGRHLSLQARLVLGLGSVLLPFVAAAAIGTFYLLPALLAPLEEIIHEVSDELEPLRQLQLALLTAGMAAQRRAEIDADVVDLGRRVDEAFAAVLAAPFADATERQLIDAASREWRQARSLIVPAAGQPAGTRRARFAFHVESAAALLEQLYVPAREEMDRSRSAAQAARNRSLGATFIAFVAALVVSLFAAVRIASPIVADIGSLRRGAARLSGGELSYRVSDLRNEELGDLGAAFNAMAERIEKDQKALAELATRDGLTGLLNRREFLRLLREELERSRRYGHACAVVLIDLDRFKTVNDSWGHPAGDAVLRAVAERLLNEARPSDRVCRHGGEEFALLLPETPSQGAATAAERIRAAIGAVPVPVSQERSIAVSASFGVAIFPGDGADEQSLVAAADRALYAAKEGGRNRVVLASPEAG